MSNLTVEKLELIYASTATGTAKASFTSEFASLNDEAGMGPMASIPPYFWQQGASQSLGRGFRVVARGILSSTATPTYTFSLRLGGKASTSGPIVLGSTALTTGSGVSNQMWEFEGDVILTALGTTAATATARGIGMLACGGLASPFTYPLWGGAASPGTVATVDQTITNYFNFNIACSASSPSNTITLQQLIILGF